MKAIELLKIGAEILRLMSNVDLRTDDYKHVELFEEYWSMRLSGVKVDAILYDLAEKYGLSESTIKRIVRRFGREVTP